MNDGALPRANAELLDRRARGRARRNRVLGEPSASTDVLSALLRDASDEFVWGTVWEDPHLDEKLRIAVALALAAARSRPEVVEQYGAAALRAGWSRQELAEMLLHVACYAGFLAADAALVGLKTLFEAVDANLDEWPESARAPVRADDPADLPLSPETVDWIRRRPTSDLAARGIQIRREILGAENVDAWMERTVGDDFTMMFFDATHAYCFGTLWARSGLERRVRSVLSLAINASQNQDGAVARHVRSCVHAGFGRREIGEILLLVYAYTGVYACLGGFTVAQKVFAEMESEGIAVPMSGTEA